MAAETQIIEFPLAEGQNEGTAIEVLPVGQFSSLQNARFRKAGLLGKRNGYAALSSLDSNGAALGNGGGRLSCLGPQFAVVDDRFYLRNTTADAWTVSPMHPSMTTRLLASRFPQFVPAPVIDVSTQDSLPAAPDQAGGLAYAFGHVWTAEARARAGSVDWTIHVEAHDPATGDVVWFEDISLVNAPNTTAPAAQLLVTLSGTLVLFTDRYTAGAKSAMVAYNLTSVVAGFGAAQVFACIESAVNYGVNPGFPDSVVLTWVEAATTTAVRTGYYLTLTNTINASVATSITIGNKSKLSIFQDTDGVGAIRVGFVESVGPTVRSLTYSSSLIFASAADWTTAFAVTDQPIVWATRSAGNALGIIQNVTSPTLHVGLVDSGGVLSKELSALAVEYLSWPFRVDGQVYLWVRHMAADDLGVASLIRIPPSSEYPGGAGGQLVVPPLEATLDDRDVYRPLAVQNSGPPCSTPVATPLGYVALLNYTRDSFVAGGGITFRRRAFLLATVRHRSEGVRYSSSCVVPCWGRQFVASAQPMWVDRGVVYEAGFVQAPLIVSASPGGGGSLTANSAYSYTALFQSSDSSTIDRSAPATPFTVSAGSMGANTKITLTVSVLGLSARRQVSCRIYRTLANASVFQFVGEFDATPGITGSATVTFVDTNADGDVEQNEPLYTFVGQEQPATNFPACSFANTGGSRLWAAGGFAGNIVQASKMFVPRVAPEFVDDDAWRVTLPADCTGAAWCDAQVLFTQEGIYVVSGDGPDVAGVGFFTTSRLPFNIGCIDWRSVAVCDLGIFFQSPRGLYLLPRGFGQPVAMDQVLDTLTSYPVITAAHTDFNSLGGADNSEQLVQWCATTDEGATQGVVITFDVAYKAFYVDTCLADFPVCFLNGWSGEAVQAPAVTTIGGQGAAFWHPFRVRDAGYDDAGLPIQMRAITGDLRPWGSLAHGVINRMGILARLLSACTLSVAKITDRGFAGASRTYTGTPPDHAFGEDVYLEVALGNAEQRDVTALRVIIDETSAAIGVQLVSMVFETDTKPQGFRLLRPADRIT